MREQVDTAAGTGWLESGGDDWWLVYESEAAHQPLGNVFEHGTYINEPAYSWAAGPADNPSGDGKEDTREQAVAAVLRASRRT